MGNVARLVAKGPEVGGLMLKIAQGITAIGADHPTRKNELHVSDFTMAPEQWCVRTLIRRWLRGDMKERKLSAVQLDGKWREDKWHRIFQAAHILKQPGDYQTELRIGPLVGHPDFILKWGFGRRIIELTGHDQRIAPKLLAQRLAVKKRQNLMYQAMAKYLRLDVRLGGFIIVEDKGNNAYQILEVPWDAQKAGALFQRVLDAVTGIRRLQAAKTLRAKQRVWQSFTECGKRRCDACGKPAGGPARGRGLRS